MAKTCILPASDLLAFCLMPNHFHFLLHAREICGELKKQGGLLLDPLTNGFRKLLSGYTRIYNHNHHKSGSLFRQKTKAKCLSDTYKLSGNALTAQDYYLNCFLYIHQNPLKAGLVKKLEDWEFSSFREYAGLKTECLCSKEIARQFCSYNEKEFINLCYEIVPEKIFGHFK